MLSLLVITCIIFQTAIAFFLLNGVRTDDDIEKHLRALLVILLVHLSTKFLLLAALQDTFFYAQMPTGFGLAYGPLLLIIARSCLGRPMRPRVILYQFIPFFLFSLIYVSLVIAGIRGVISRSAITAYASWYEYLVLASLCGYPVYVKILLRNSRTKKTRLTAQMANVLLLGISMGLLLSVLHWTAIRIPGFDLRILPYMCFSAIPILMLRYRLQKSDERQKIENARTADNTPDTIAPLPWQTSVPQQSPAHPDTTADAAAAKAAAATDRRYEKSGMDASRMDEYEAALAAYMGKSRIFLDPDLSLESLAYRMKMPKHHLTQLLNERVMKNFYTYINEYRIGEAIDRLNNPTAQVNILSLAFDCGFNSRSSFNNYFKKITGHTPSAYRKLQLENKAGKTGRPPRLIPGTSPSVS